MVWTDPSKLTDEEIESKLGEISTEIRDALASGSQLGELSSKLWRLRAEAQFRQRRTVVQPHGGGSNE
jgi:hypothetical protein